MTTKLSSYHLASEGSFDTVSTDSLSEMRALVAEYAEDPNGAVLDGWEPREGTIVTEVRAISARINQNFDAWPSEELKAAHHTFVGKPVFVNHNNHDPSRARGRVVASRYVDAGENDRYVQVLQEVEASRFPLLAKELMEGGLDSVSMGAEAREVECSVCANISTSPFDACEHIPMKGATLQRRTASGTPEDVLIYEICRKISFFELSYVFDPADETAVASNVLVANRREAVSEVEVPPKVDTLHPDDDDLSRDDWQEYVDDPNVIDTIDVLDEPDLGLNQELDRAEDEIPEGFEEFEGIEDEIEANEQAEAELAQESRERAQEKADEEAAAAQEQFEQTPDPEDDENWEDEDDGAGGKTSRFKDGSLEIMVADDYGTWNMWMEKDGSLIASDSYLSEDDAKAAAIAFAKEHRAEWAGYKDFDDCKQQNSNADDPDAYCGEIKNRADKESKMSRTSRRIAKPIGDPKFEVGDTVTQIDAYETESGKGTVDDMRQENGGWTYDVIWEDGSTTSVGQAALKAKTARRRTAAPLDGWDMSFNNAAATFQERDFQLWVATDDYDDGTENWQVGEWSVYDSTFSEVASGHENSPLSAAYAAIIAAEEEGFDTSSVPEPKTYASRTSNRHNGSNRPSRDNDRETSRKESHMAPQRRRRIGDNNKQTPLLEETGIAQTPAPEPVALPEEGDDHPNDSESDRVQTARRALAREIALDRARKARQRQAAPVGEQRSGPSVAREDLFETYPEITMTARLRKRFATWVGANYGCSVRQASGPAELQTWARVFSREAGIELSHLHAAIKRDVQALRTAGEDDSAEADFIENSGDADAEGQANYVEDSGDGDDKKESRRHRAAYTPSVGDTVKIQGENSEGTVTKVNPWGTEAYVNFPGKGEKSYAVSALVKARNLHANDDSEDDDKKEAGRRAVERARRRRAATQARRGRTQTTRRRTTADSKLDLAAPGDRVNVEKPTSDTTSDEGQASQFNRSDFDNNSGKGLEDPDTTGTPGIPGGPSVNDLKRSSARASGLQAVKLAEAEIAVGLIENSSEAKFKAAAEYERMSRDIVLDRTALLEKVAKVQASRRPSTKSAGNRGASLPSAVPPNMTGMTRSSAPQAREAASAHDSDLFF